MVITIPFLGLEGQTFSSLKDDMTTSTTLQGRRKLAMVIFLSFLELEYIPPIYLEDQP